MSYQEWKNNIKPEKKERKYQHIDDSLNIDNKKTFQKVINIINDVKNHQFLPFIRREETQVRFRSKNHVTKRSFKKRPIMYASHIDSHIYSYYNFILCKKYENFLVQLNLQNNVIAYRKVKIETNGKGKGNVHFAKEVFDYIKKQNECVVVTHDIEGFFDNIDHTLLKNAVCKISNTDKLDDSFYKVFKSLTKYRYIQFFDFKEKQLKKKIKGSNDPLYKTLKGLFFENKTNKGIPQGSPISGLFANIYLINFDNEIKKAFPNVFYRRYSDDLIFVCKDDEKEKLNYFISEEIKKNKLNINKNKSFVSNFRKKVSDIVCELVTDGLGNKLNRNYVDYLGLEFDGKGTLLRKNTIQKLKKKQNKKVQKQVLNTVKQKRRKPRRNTNGVNKNKSNYLKRVTTIINEPGVKKQVLQVSRKRNKARMDALKKMTTQTP